MPKLSRWPFIAFLLISRPYRALVTLRRDTKIGGRYCIAGQRRTFRLYWRIMRMYDECLIHAPHMLHSMQRQLEEWHVDQQAETATQAKEEPALSKLHPFEPFFQDWSDSELRNLREQHLSLATKYTIDNELDLARVEWDKATRLKELLAERQKHSHDLNSIWKPDLSE